MQLKGALYVARIQVPSAPNLKSLINKDFFSCLMKDQTGQPL